jgi:hypothetical protein
MFPSSCWDVGAAEALWRSLLTTLHVQPCAIAREHCLCALSLRFPGSLRRFIHMNDHAIQDFPATTLETVLLDMDPNISAG